MTKTEDPGVSASVAPAHIPDGQVVAYLSDLGVTAELPQGRAYFCLDVSRLCQERNIAAREGNARIIAQIDELRK